MEIIRPEIGAIFWTILSFLIAWIILRQFAWKPILNVLRERDKSIKRALQSADSAKEEMKRLEAKNEEMVKEAKLERESLLNEAREQQSKILNEARENAKEETERMISKARKEIEAERKEAFSEMKNEIVDYSIQIAEKILRKELDNKEAQKEVAEQYIKDINTN